VSRLCIASLFLLAAVVVLQAQDQPTFRTGANYVRVDMYATVDGKSVDDLTAEEVDVLEDGVPQKLEAFEHVQVRPGRSTGSPPRAEHDRRESSGGRRSARQSVRHLSRHLSHDD
jgi:hypothetical protein